MVRFYWSAFGRCCKYFTMWNKMLNFLCKIMGNKFVEIFIKVSTLEMCLNWKITLSMSKIWKNIFQSYGEDLQVINYQNVNFLLLHNFLIKNANIFAMHERQIYRKTTKGWSIFLKNVKFKREIIFNFTFLN